VTGRTVAGPPHGSVAVPAAVPAVAGAEQPKPVWRNEAGGVTFALPASRPFVTW
jgi:kanamycin kinase